MHASVSCTGQVNVFCHTTILEDILNKFPLPISLAHPYFVSIMSQEIIPSFFGWIYTIWLLIFDAINNSQVYFHIFALTKHIIVK